MAQYVVNTDPTLSFEEMAEMQEHPDYLAQFGKMGVDPKAGMAFTKEYKQATDQIKIQLEKKYRVVAEGQLIITITGPRKGHVVTEGS